MWKDYTYYLELGEKIRNECITGGIPESSVIKSYRIRVIIHSVQKYYDNTRELWKENGTRFWNNEYIYELIPAADKSF